MKTARPRYPLFSLSGLTVLAGLIFLSGCGAPTPEAVPALKQAASSDLVRLTPEAVRKSGIQVARVSDRPHHSRISTIAEVKADENQVFHLSSLVGGRLIKDQANLGDRIRQGQTVAVIRNQEVVKAQAASIHELHNNEIAIQQAKTRLKLARQNYQREKALYADGVSPRKDLLLAQSELELAQSALSGYEEHKTHVLSEAKALLGTYGVAFDSQSERLQTGSPIVAPRSGVVTRKTITLGDTVSADQILYEVADLSRVWLDMTVYPQDLAGLRLGQSIRFTSDSLPKRVFMGRINYIPPNTNAQSPVFMVRAFLDNTDYSLKPGMFGQAEIDSASRESMPFVPEKALQKYGREAFVFIPLGNNQYRKQPVTIDSQDSTGYFIRQGLKAGTPVVTEGSFTLKGEMLKKQLGED
ncbi:efflux RND transporter periplasmic adaptor subunit [Vampirovibrio chlorellavorus]|uniref:efflux RND transporter periplasmic adaptor subunit n=1 Tax=Vampirovibrio chlorellavorus TaxID=758823 RepID=UPI0026EA4258|nr:efflux RND transporter periplasmic adaptor subunit [Vampirovibrio chlorellavorus]